MIVDLDILHKCIFDSVHSGEAYLRTNRYTFPLILYLQLFVVLTTFSQIAPQSPPVTIFQTPPYRGVWVRCECHTRSWAVIIVVRRVVWPWLMIAMPFYGKWGFQMVPRIMFHVVWTGEWFFWILCLSSRWQSVFICEFVCVMRVRLLWCVLRTLREWQCLVFDLMWIGFQLVSLLGCVEVI